MSREAEPIVTYSWNEHEDKAFQLLKNNLAAALYLRGLRKHMDISTGMAGVFSYEYFIRLLAEDRDRGSNTPTSRLSKQAVSSLIDRLESVGLIECVSTTQLIFYLPLAVIDSPQFG